MKFVATTGRGLKLLTTEDDASAKSTRSGEPCETSLHVNMDPIFGRRRRRRRRRRDENAS